eukprot:TRINITY_DN7043_c0_g3_i1.p1 TRINITY_DN7043_c0_g3~~TRINITY_DN7043_c0_g3_i1.p1  ORF type:complete len:271 (+),score=40.27 TRINITY_DN7043_c0_g3_i1:42-854(+)
MLFSATKAVVFFSFVSLSDGFRLRVASNMTMQRNQLLSFDLCDFVKENKLISEQCSCSSSKGRLELDCSASVRQLQLGVKIDMALCDIPARANVVVTQNEEKHVLFKDSGTGPLALGGFVKIPGMSVSVQSYELDFGVSWKQSGDEVRTITACLDACTANNPITLCAAKLPGVVKSELAKVLSKRNDAASYAAGYASKLPWCFFEHTYDLKKVCGTDICNKQTARSCHFWQPCSESLGETDCIGDITGGKCYCKEGSCFSKDTGKCVKRA